MELLVRDKLTEIVMNKIIKYSSAFALALAVISCNEKIETDLSDAGDYITVTSDTDSQVKAGYEGISVLPATFHMDISSPLFSGTMTRDGSSNKYDFPSGDRLTWGNTDVDAVTIKAITQPSGYNRKTGAMTVQFDQSSDANVQASDLLGAVTGYGVTINKNNINISFRHLMAKMYVTYSAASNVVVTSIKLKNICRSGVFSYTDLTYNSDNARGDINMFHDTEGNTYEAIFFPYTPSSVPLLEVTANIDGASKNFECPISLSKITSFEGGKRYIMNIVVTGSNIEGAEVTVKDWNMDTNSIQVPGQKVLWIGTSIPAGNLAGGIKSYPYLVDDAMNCEVVNNAVAGSLVIKSVAEIRMSRTQFNSNADYKAAYGDYSNYLNALKLAWDNYEQKDQTIYGKDANYGEYATNHLLFGGLAQTHADIEAYRNDLEEIGGSNWADKHIRKLKELSYMSRIIPYINGEKDNCTTVILDHGFNDRASLIYEAIGYGEGGEIVPGYNYLMKIKARTVTYDQYVERLNQWENLTLNGNYIVDMTNIIKAIQQTNPNVMIIIGNYFTLNCPFVTKEYTWTATNPDLMSTNYMNYGNLICYFNEAVAGANDLQVVNVYEYLNIDEDRYWNFNYDTWKAAYDSTPQDQKAAISPLSYINQDWTKFCPDGVHPFNVDALKTIAEIYIRELDGVIGSRGRDNTAANNASGASIDALGIDSWDEEIVL